MSVQSAQRRPESKPRRHCRLDRRARAAFSSAQRRPESKPRRHGRASRVDRLQMSALNEGRSRNPGDTAFSRLRFPAHSTLNEGRSRNPGDTCSTKGTSTFRSIAQRRPESKPRRHVTPKLFLQKRPTDAQRRPESKPRRHTPAMKRPPALSVTLNEGRSRNPGDTAQPALLPAPGPRRSTKAGVETPATRAMPPRRSRSRPALNEGRSRNPGDTSRARRARPARPALNEGRSRNPGDTCAECGLLPPGPNAQRRPESKPRRHL